MKKITLALYTTIFSLFLISCQKELTMDSSLGGSMPSLDGKWKFIDMNTKTESIVELSDGVDVIKTITLSEFISTKNTGTLDIDASKVTSTGFGYAASTIAIGYIFENNILLDSVTAPFSFVSPPTNSVAPYTRVSADSLYFGAGQFISIGGATSPSSPSGVKLQFQGDKLLMTVRASFFDVQTVLGITQSKRESAVAVMTYQKQ